MKMSSVFALVLAILVGSSPLKAQVKTVEPKPLSQVVRSQLKPVQSGALRVPLITWGGDVATVLADSQGIFRNEKLDVKLFVENDFSKQVQGCLDGQTPFLRGTMGMINSAAESFKASGTDLVIVYQMTWSNGGDCMVVRPGVKTPKDLKGKSIGLQLYGPHMDYAANILSNAGLAPDQVNFRWFKEMSLPTYDAGKSIIDPVSAFVSSKDLDAIMCISPDAAKLTSNGAGGTGAEGSVKGAQILLSSKPCSTLESQHPYGPPVMPVHL